MKCLNLFALFLALASLSNSALAANRNYICTSIGTAPTGVEIYADKASLVFSDEEKFNISGRSVRGKEFDCSGRLTQLTGFTRSGMIDKINSPTCNFLGGSAFLQSNDLGKVEATVSVTMADRRFHFKCVE